jgi:HK97 family phage major capsid protein
MLREERDALAAKVEALTILAQEEERDFTEEEQSQIDSIIGAEENQGELADINAKIKREERLDEIRRDIAASRGQQAIVPNVVPGEINMKTVTVPAKAKKRGAVKSFVGPDAEKEAYLSGLFYQAAFTGNQDAKNKLDGYGIQMAQTTYDNTAGGFLVPDILETNLIRLVEQYGIARQECRVMPMGVGGTFSVPRRAGGYTAYFVGENAAGTESDLSFDLARMLLERNRT